ncbi:DUF2513 domain-containing protein [Leptothoe sp. PORK10 BA2]|uniref:DUF2513 domain-containing protein n=1 Tax=Leptothoe sp. PORK10 BA2 TaxID=3110254 RepID=UPI002B1F6BE3|nr:DUF2513 domain-containing protein [Leptothoe sp. PORK10 BA2]MEA5467218.1 DUF2513 domain-containing protein [Leptothoe sp. PORK10 BA2]
MKIPPIKVQPEMKRDMELIREIVFAVEGEDENFLEHFQIEGYSIEKVAYHCYQLVQGGYAEGRVVNDMKNKRTIITNLTWEGHEFADLARSQTVWQKTMKLVKDRSDTVGMGVLMQLLAATAKSIFGL